MIYNSQHQLTFGGLDLTGATGYAGAKFYAMADGATLGNPQPVDKEVDTLLFDGSFVLTESHGNRTIGFQVRIEADDSDTITQAEALLFAQCSKQTTLVWAPPDGQGAPTTFAAFTSHLELQFSDMDEMRLTRAYNLTLICSPFGFSESEVVTVASTPPPATVTTVVMSDGTSASGWTSPTEWPAQPTVVGGAVFVRTRGLLPNGAGTSANAEATYAFAPTDFTVTKYLYVDVKAQTQAVSVTRTGDRPQFASESYARKIWLFVNGSTTPLEQFSATPNPDGSIRYTWVVTGSAVTSLLFRAGAQDGNPSGVYFDNVTRTNAAPGQSATGRQSLRTLDVPGSARSAASISIEHATAGLGRTIHYTSSVLGVGGYQPNLIQYAQIVAPVTSTGDAATVSGSYKRTGFANGGIRRIELLVPVQVLPPGPYLIMGRLRAQTPAAAMTVKATVSQLHGSTSYGTTVLPGSFVSPLGASTQFDDFTIFGVTTLPPQNTAEESTTGTVKIALDSQVNAQTNNFFDVDELWAFHLGEGSDLTIVNGGTGTPALGAVHNRLFIDSPTPNDPSPNLLVGTTADRSDAFDPGYPAVAARGVHPVTPPQAQAFVVTTGATYATVTYRVLPAWFTHAAKLPGAS